MEPGFLVLIVLIAFVALFVIKAIALIPQGQAAVIERLGRYTRTVEGGLTFLVPSSTGCAPGWTPASAWCPSRPRRSSPRTT